MKNILSQQEQQKESQQVKQTLQQQQNQQLSIPAVNSNPNPKEATPI